MKKIITLAFLLALVAVMAVPMAAFAATGVQNLGGSVVGGTITVTPPSAIAFGTLSADDSPITKSAVTKGRITVVPGTSGAEAWTCSVKQSALETKMKFSTYTLFYELLIAEDDDAYSTGLWHKTDGSAAGTVNGTGYAAGALEYKGTASQTDLSFKALQHVSAANDTNAGAYAMTLTWTATLDVI